MVAQLTISLLKDGARQEFARLYGDGWQQEVVARSAMVQAEIDRPKNRYLAPLQLTLFQEGDKAFDPEKHCLNNACSVGAILESQQVLLQPNYPDSQKRQALMYLMHYMLQMHVPVNCGFKRDMGGQKIYLKDDDLKPVNFAWIWNIDLYRQQGKRWFTYAQELSRQIPTLDAQAWVKTMSVADWAYETHQVAVDQAYPLALGGRYSAQLKKEGIKILELQLMKAAYRTAALLNRSFPSKDGATD